MQLKPEMIKPHKLTHTVNPHPPTQTMVVMLICIILILLIPKSISSSYYLLEARAPLPLLPIPSYNQLKWQQTEMAMFLHFGTNTFTDSEWGTGHSSPSVFSPTSLSAAQWVQTASQNGFSRLILTAKHHDGFCLWPSEYTDYSVRSSDWRNGSGDVVAELAEAALNSGLQLGVYLSPWDRHEGTYGKTLEYNEFYLAQMTELLTRYGVVREVWLDGAKGEGEKDMKYFFDTWFNLIHQLQPQAVIFSDAGPDVRWVGDESGVAPSTCWSTFNRSDASIGGTDPQYSQEGDPFGHDWVPAECDVSIRPGWFWHPSESPKSARTLLEIYYNSVGRNCLFLLNVPPNSSGLISDEDIQVLREFTELRESIFSQNLAENAHVTASSTRNGSYNDRFNPQNILKEDIDTYWAPGENQQEWVLHLDIKSRVICNVLQVREPIQMGQRVTQFHLDALNKKGHWVKVVSGTTVGYKRLLRFPKIETYGLRFVIEQSRAEPLISYLAIHMDAVSSLSFTILKNSSSYFNRSELAIDHVVHNQSQIVWM